MKKLMNDKRLKVAVSVLLIVIALLILLYVYLSHITRVGLDFDCRGDRCFGEIEVYENASNKFVCSLAGGEYEERYDGYGYYSLCLVK